MPENPASVARALVIHPVESTRRALRQLLRATSGGPATVHDAESLTEGLRAARWFDPRYVLVDLSEERSLALEVVREIRRADRLVIGLYNPLLLREREDDFFRAAARAGVGDFVPLPASEAELAAALGAVPRASREPTGGRTIVFFGHKGGAGTTTLAVNTALLLAGSGEAGEVALCDAALQFGDAAALLGLAPDRDLADMAHDLDELGALSAYLSRHQETGLRVLARPRELGDAEAVTPEELSRLLIHLQRRFDFVVVDTAAVLDLMTLAVFDLAEKIFIVTEAVTPTVLGTGRLLRLLETQGFAAERLRIVVNRYASSDGNLPPGTIAQQLGRPVDYVVSHDRSLVAAANRGAPLILGRQRGEFSDVVRRIAEDAVRPVLGRPEPVATAG